MITDDLLQLITAGIDGELTPLEGRRLAQLLNSSAEARAIHSKLLADSRKLNALPRFVPPADLHSKVMSKIASLTPVPSRLTKLPQRTTKAEPARKSLPFKPNSPRWVPVAVAAGLLLCVTTGSFLFFNQKNAQTTKDVATRRPPAGAAGAGDPAWAKWLPAESGPRPSAPTGRDLPPVFEHLMVRKDFPPVGPSVDVVAIAPSPRIKTDLIGAPILPETKFETVEVRLPFLKSVSAFDGEDVRQMLADELNLNQTTSFRLDLFTRNPVRAVELFREASKAAGVNLLVDGNTMAQLQKRTATASVIYTESLTAEEIATLIGKLNAEDAKVSPHVFDMLHALPASQHDANDLKSIFGSDPGLFKRPADKATDKSSRTPDPSKPLSAGTADQIVRTVLSGGGAPGEKSAVLLTWNLVQGRQVSQATSAELKSFMAKRVDRKVNAVPVIIVIRPGNG